jgi:hypothetical protein
MFKLKSRLIFFFGDMLFFNVLYYFLFVYTLSMFMFSFIKQLKILIHWLPSIIFKKKSFNGHKMFDLLMSPFLFINFYLFKWATYFLHWHILLYPKVLKLISMMSSCLCLQIDKPKTLLFLNINSLLCYFCILLFDMRMHECLEKILRWAKWKCNISFLMHSSTFTLQFGFVWN